jgi:hypothetical protein
MREGHLRLALVQDGGQAFIRGLAWVGAPGQWRVCLRHSVVFIPQIITHRGQLAAHHYHYRIRGRHHLV